VDEKNAPITSARLVEISGKVVEEVGFDKIRKLLARVEDLKIVILDSMRIVSAVGGGDDGRFGAMTVAETCPKIVELDLSHNLFVDFSPLVDVCSQLPDLRSLRLKYVSAHAAFLYGLGACFTNRLVLFLPTVAIDFRRPWATAPLNMQAPSFLRSRSWLLRRLFSTGMRYATSPRGSSPLPASIAELTSWPPSPRLYPRRSHRPLPF